MFITNKVQCTIVSQDIHVAFTNEISNKYTVCKIKAQCITFTNTIIIYLCFVHLCLPLPQLVAENAHG